MTHSCMATSTPNQQTDRNLPDRDCTWCKIPMRKRLVGEGRFIHYTCPECIFQHTAKFSEASST